MTPLDTPMGELTTVLGWLMWLVIVLCAGSFLVAAGRLGLALRNGGETDGLRGLLLTAVVSVIAGAAATIANVLL